MQNSEIIATKVHGWVKKVHSRRPDAWYKPGSDTYEKLVFPAPCGYHTDEQFNPEENENDAIAALRAWRKGSAQRDWRLQSDGDIEYVVLFDHIDLCALPDIMVTAEDGKSLSAAIVEALLLACGEVG